jgi:heavy metal sensor kinase
MAGTRRLSVRSRLTLWYTAALLAILALTSAASYSLLRWSVLHDVDASLLTVAHVIADTETAGARPPWDAGAEALLRELLGPELYDKFFRLLDPSGRPSMQSAPPRGATLALSPAARANAARGERTFETMPRSGRAPIRLLTLPMVHGGALTNIVQVGMSLERAHRTLDRFLEILFVLVPVGGLLAGAGGYALARAALRPVDEMSQTARRISAEDLTRRIEPRRTGDELDRLAETLNGMLSRLEAAFANLRRFAADAAHELRTPLTVLKGQLEVALRADRPAEEYRRVLQASLEEVEELTRLAEDLLLLSRATAGLAGPREPVELEPLLREVAAAAARLGEPSGVSVKVGPATPLVILGDAAALRRAVLNVAENAVRYTPAGGEVELTLARQGQEAALGVRDTGPGIAPADAERVFQPFVRLDAGRVTNPAGTGLGLAIARSVVMAHGGAVALESEPGFGARFTIRLPLA